MRWNKTLTVVGAHAEGEVGNVVIGGIVDVRGKTMFEKMKYMEEHMDHIRKLLLFEPRGAPYNNTNVLLPPTRPEADLGFLIMSTTEYSPMSGSNTICVATVALETGIVPMQEPETRLVMEAPAGLIEVSCHCRDGKVTEVEFKNVPCFMLHGDKKVEVESVGTVTVDAAYGGIIYGIVDAASLGFQITPDEAADMCAVGRKVKAACNEQLECVHPENDQIRDITNLVLAGPVESKDDRLSSRSGTVVLHGRLDRSPCGTGTSARLACLYAKNQIKMNQVFVNHSITGTRFRAKIVDTTEVGGIPAVVPTIAGQAWITGIMQFGLDPTDPFPEGHMVADVW